MEMEGAILSTQSNKRFRTQLKNTTNALHVRTLPKQWRESTSTPVKHHTYPRTTPPKRAAISCRMEAPLCAQLAQIESPATSYEQQDSGDLLDGQHDRLDYDRVTKGTLMREVASAWECRVGTIDQAAPADRVQSLFNDIELYPTKSQVFEMLVCARQCARRKSVILTFGEFCVFAAELRRCSKQARQYQTTNKPESPLWNVEKEVLKDKDQNSKNLNGSEASPPPPQPYEVFLGGSCNPTTWRSDIAIPILKKMGITYFNPQVENWSTELMEVEYRAKSEARALLFVLDSETRAVAACVEAAHLAAAPRDLLLVLRPYSRHQTIGRETISDQEYVELSRARATLQEAVERRGLPAFTDIVAALRCARAVLRGARTHPRHPLGHTILRLKRVYDGAGGRNTRLSRGKAVDALRDVTRAPRELVERCLPTGTDAVDFETFCAAVAELASDAGLVQTIRTGAVSVGVAHAAAPPEGVAARVRRAFRSLRTRLAAYAPETPNRNGVENESTVASVAGGGATGNGADAPIVPSGRNASHLRVYNERLKAYGRKLALFIPKNGGRGSGTNVASDCESGGGGTDSGGDSVFTPGTEQRLERLPAMLGAPTHDVYLGGSFPSDSVRPEEVLRREGLTYIVPRANDYTRMFSAGARRSASSRDTPHRDKKPRQHATDSPVTPTRARCSEASCQLEEVQLRERSPDADSGDRLSASEFYKVTEDITPQPFKGTYDEDLLLGSRVLVFSMSSDAPCFSAMVLAAHYMGLRPTATVLIVQPMQLADSQPYSEAAVKDYNRGRHYLSDLAQRSGVPVFADVGAAMNCVVDKLRTTL